MLKKITVIFVILFCTTLPSYALESKSVPELQEEVDNLRKDYEKKQKDVSDINSQLSALAVRIHEANARLQAARQEEAEQKSRE